MNLRTRKDATPDVLHIYTDASVLRRGAGLAAIIKDARGGLLAWRMKPAPCMTNNEAEYCAILFALEQAQPMSPREVHIFSDSEVIIRQLRGEYGAHIATMQQLRERVLALAGRFPCVTFTRIPRDENALADALASEAICPSRHKPNRLNAD
jgi:ribonuclease HI